MNIDHAARFIPNTIFADENDFTDYTTLAKQDKRKIRKPFQNNDQNILTSSRN